MFWSSISRNDSNKFLKLHFHNTVRLEQFLFWKRTPLLKLIELLCYKRSCRQPLSVRFYNKFKFLAVCKVSEHFYTYKNSLILLPFWMSETFVWIGTVYVTIEPAHPKYFVQVRYVYCVEILEGLAEGVQYHKLWISIPTFVQTEKNSSTFRIYLLNSNSKLSFKNIYSAL